MTNKKRFNNRKKKIQKPARKRLTQVFQPKLKYLSKRARLSKRRHFEDRRSCNDSHKSSSQVTVGATCVFYIWADYPAQTYAAFPESMTFALPYIRPPLGQGHNSPLSQTAQIENLKAVVRKIRDANREVLQVGRCPAAHEQELQSLDVVTRSPDSTHALTSKFCPPGSTDKHDGKNNDRRSNDTVGGTIYTEQNPSIGDDTKRRLSVDIVSPIRNTVAQKLRNRNRPSNNCITKQWAGSKNETKIEVTSLNTMCETFKEQACRKKEIQKEGTSKNRPSLWKDDVKELVSPIQHTEIKESCRFDKGFRAHENKSRLKSPMTDNMENGAHEKLRETKVTVPSNDDINQSPPCTSESQNKKTVRNIQSTSREDIIQKRSSSKIKFREVGAIMINPTRYPTESPQTHSTETRGEVSSVQSPGTLRQTATVSSMETSVGDNSHCSPHMSTAAKDSASAQIPGASKDDETSCTPNQRRNQSKEKSSKRSKRRNKYKKSSIGTNDKSIETEQVSSNANQRSNKVQEIPSMSNKIHSKIKETVSTPNQSNSKIEETFSTPNQSSSKTEETVTTTNQRESKNEESSTPNQSDSKIEETFSTPHQSNSKIETFTTPNQTGSEKSSIPNQRGSTNEESSMPNKSDSTIEETSKPNQSDSTIDETSKPNQSDSKIDETSKPNQSDSTIEETSKPNERESKCNIEETSPTPNRREDYVRRKQNLKVDTPDCESLATVTVDTCGASQESESEAVIDHTHPGSNRQLHSSQKTLDTNDSKLEKSKTSSNYSLSTAEERVRNVLKEISAPLCVRKVKNVGGMKMSQSNSSRQKVQNQSLEARSSKRMVSTSAASLPAAPINLAHHEIPPVRGSHGAAAEERTTSSLSTSFPSETQCFASYPSLKASNESEKLAVKLYPFPCLSPLSSEFSDTVLNPSPKSASLCEEASVVKGRRVRRSTAPVVTADLLSDEDDYFSELFRFLHARYLYKLKIENKCGIGSVRGRYSFDDICLEFPVDSMGQFKATSLECCLRRSTKLEHWEFMKHTEFTRFRKPIKYVFVSARTDESDSVGDETNGNNAIFVANTEGVSMNETIKAMQNESLLSSGHEEAMLREFMEVDTETSNPEWVTDERDRAWLDNNFADENSPCANATSTPTDLFDTDLFDKESSGQLVDNSAAVQRSSECSALEDTQWFIPVSCMTDSGLSEIRYEWTPFGSTNFADYAVLQPDGSLLMPAAPANGPGSYRQKEVDLEGINKNPSEAPNHPCPFTFEYDPSEDVLSFRPCRPGSPCPLEHTHLQQTVDVNSFIFHRTDSSKSGAEENVVNCEDSSPVEKLELSKEKQKDEEATGGVSELGLVKEKKRKKKKKKRKKENATHEQEETLNRSRELQQNENRIDSSQKDENDETSITLTQQPVTSGKSLEAAQKKKEVDAISKSLQTTPTTDRNGKFESDSNVVHFMAEMGKPFDRYQTFLSKEVQVSSLRLSDKQYNEREESSSPESLRNLEVKGKSKKSKKKTRKKQRQRSQDNAEATQAKKVIVSRRGQCEDRKTVFFRECLNLIQKTSKSEPDQRACESGTKGTGKSKQKQIHGNETGHTPKILFVDGLTSTDDEDAAETRVINKLIPYTRLNPVLYERRCPKVPFKRFRIRLDEIPVSRTSINLNPGGPRCIVCGDLLSPKQTVVCLLCSAVSYCGERCRLAHLCWHVGRCRRLAPLVKTCERIPRDASAYMLDHGLTLTTRMKNIPVKGEGESQLSYTLVAEMIGFEEQAGTVTARLVDQSGNYANCVFLDELFNSEGVGPIGEQVVQAHQKEGCKATTVAIPAGPAPRALYSPGEQTTLSKGDFILVHHVKWTQLEREGLTILVEDGMAVTFLPRVVE